MRSRNWLTLLTQELVKALLSSLIISYYNLNLKITFGFQDIVHLKMVNCYKLLVKRGQLLYNVLSTNTVYCLREGVSSILLVSISNSTG